MRKSNESKLKPKFGIGTLLSIPCNINDGALRSEKVIQCEVASGKMIKGIVPTHFTISKNGDQTKGRVVAVVAERTKDSVSLLFSGEILTPGNPVKIPFDWIQAHSKVESALNK